MLKLQDYNKGLIYTKTDVCIYCSKCIHDCPILKSNVSVMGTDGSYKMCVDERECILCGACINNCVHNARHFKDDCNSFFTDLKNGKSFSVIIAPAFYLKYSDEYKRVLGWLKSMGVKNFYSVSAGADIATWAYIKYINNNSTIGNIAQPCPAIVSHIEKHLPQLLPNIIPIQSPMMCTAIYLRSYKNIQEDLVFLSPCIAKKIEINSKRGQGLIRYNVTFNSIMNYIRDENVSLSEYPEVTDEISYGMGSIFPEPGGLSENLEYYLGPKFLVTQLDGPARAYKYLESFAKSVESKDKYTPTLVDIINCKMGCSYGTGTEPSSFNENSVAYQAFLMRAQKHTAQSPKDRLTQLNQNWEALKLEDFMCEYEADKSICTHKATDTKIETILNEKLLKFTHTDMHIDCSACGYKTCKEMAAAIAHGINHRSNCIYYVKDYLAKSEEMLRTIIDNMPLVCNIGTKDLEILECNEEGVKVFGMRDKQEFLERFAEISPPFQPDGSPSNEKIKKLNARALETGHNRYVWMHQHLNGEPIPCEVTLVRIKWHDEDHVLAFVRDLREHYKNQEITRSVEQRLKAMLDSSPMLCAVFDIDFNIIEVNQETVRVLKLSNKQEYVEKFFKLCPKFQPDGTSSRKKFFETMRKTMQTGKGYLAEWVYQTLNGEIIPVTLYLECVKLGEKNAVIVHARDLRPIKDAMEKERQAHELNRALLDSAPFVINVWSDDYKLTNTSQQSVEMFELTGQSEYIEKFFSLSPEFQPDGSLSTLRAQNAIKEAFQVGRAQFEWMHQTITGKPLPTEITLVRSKLKDRSILLGYTIDLREVKAAMEKEREAEERAKLLIDASPMACYLFDSNRNTIDFNQASRELFLKNPDRPFANEHQIADRFAKSLQSGMQRFKFDCVTSYGEEIPCEVTIVPVRYQGSHSFAVYLRDLRETKLMISEMHRREAAEQESQAKTRFLARISHEIRTPMNVVLGITEMQLQKESLPPEIEDAFLRIRSSSNLLLSLINDILDLSKVEAGKMEIITDIYETASLIVDVVQLNLMHIGSKTIDFKVYVDEKLPASFIGDELRIKQILNNILSNAFKYTQRGLVEISFKASAAAGDFVMLVVTVSDTGQGMTQEQHNTIFNEEFTRYNVQSNRAIEGSGLGMPIAHSLAKMMDGEIKVQSNPGQGSTFTVCLPQMPDGTAILGRETAENLQNFRITHKSLKKSSMFVHEPMPYGSVLIVDDVESNLYVAKGLLAPYKLNLETVQSGRHAINKIKEGRVYDIIFMDHMMPEMDGIEATKIIRKMDYVHPIVALTANAIIGQTEIFTNNGFSGFISKPIDVNQLNSYLIRFIRNKQPLEVLEAAKEQSEAYAEENVFNLQGVLTRSFLLDAKKAVGVLASLVKPPELGKDAIKEYTIYVHGMKSALSNIGRTELSNFASDLEQAGLQMDVSQIRILTPAFLVQLKEVIAELEDSLGGCITCEDDPVLLQNKLQLIGEASQCYDIERANSALAELNQKVWPQQTRILLDEIADCLLCGDYEQAAELCCANSEQIGQEG